MSVLSTHNLCAYYGDFQALFGIDIEIDSGETVAIVGANGAGKSTLMQSIAGALTNQPNAVIYHGHQIGALSAPKVLSRGIALVPEGRKLFASLSVEENLLIGRYGRRTEGMWTLKSVFELFPILGKRRNRPSTELSGGQQQMVAIGRALMSNPELLLCDELSLGLAPVIIRDIYATFPDIQSEGTSVIIVEQNISQALKVSDRVYCMMEGRVTLSGAPSELTRDQIHNAYFGTVT